MRSAVDALRWRHLLGTHRPGEKNEPNSQFTHPGDCRVRAAPRQLRPRSSHGAPNGECVVAAETPRHGTGAVTRRFRCDDTLSVGCALGASRPQLPRSSANPAIAGMSELRIRFILFSRTMGAEQMPPS